MALLLCAPGTVAAADDPVRTAVCDRIVRLQNMRVEYVVSRNMTPPSTKPSTQPLFGVTGIRQPVWGRADFRSVFVIGDSSHFIFEQQLLPEFDNESGRIASADCRYERVSYLNGVAGRVLQDMHGRVTRQIFENYPLPIYAGIEVALGLRLASENTLIDPERIRTSAVRAVGDAFEIEVAGLSGAKHVLTVDPKRGFAQTKYRMESGGHVLLEISCDDFREVEPDIVVPHHASKRSYYNVGTERRTSQTAEYQIERYELGKIDVAQMKVQYLDAVGLRGPAAQERDQGR